MQCPGGVWRALQAVASNAAWFFVSSYLILLNKELMVDYGFSYPMTISSVGMVCSSVLSWLCLKSGVVTAKADMTLDFWVKNILPVGLFMALTLWTGNVVYLHLSISFIQMFKAITPLMTMFCLYIAGLETPSGRMITAVLMTAAGLCLATFGEIYLSTVGMVALLSSSLFESVRLVITQWLLTGLKMHPIEGLAYTAPACCIWLMLGGSLLEYRQIAETRALSIVRSEPVRFLMTGMLGFGVNVLAYISIKQSSALTLKVLGAVKNAFLILFSVFFLGEVVTSLQIWGYGVSLVGFVWYNQMKLMQIVNTPSPEDGDHDSKTASAQGVPDASSKHDGLVSIISISASSDHSDKGMLMQDNADHVMPRGPEPATNR